MNPEEKDPQIIRIAASLHLAKAVNRISSDIINRARDLTFSLLKWSQDVRKSFNSL
jgi:hypothetical protein